MQLRQGCEASREAARELVVFEVTVDPTQTPAAQTLLKRVAASISGLRVHPTQWDD
jgi:hypothetical protein